MPTDRLRVRPSQTMLLSALACSALYTSHAHANASRWAARVGYFSTNDGLIGCDPVAVGSTMTSKLRYFPTDANESVQDRTVVGVRQYLRARCFNPLDGTSILTPVVGPSTDFGSDTLSLSCPADHPLMGQRVCMLETTDGSAPRYHYEGTDCGTGVSGISDGGKANVIAQLTGGATASTGFSAYVAPNGFTLPAGFGLTNDTFTTAQVGGTDLGTSFYSQGQLSFVFGDTFWHSSGDNWRGSVLVHTGDFTFSDGISFNSWSNWEGATSTSRIARELIASPHQNNDPLLPGGGEVSAIAGAGASITNSAGTTTRFLWFFSVRHWPSTTFNLFLANNTGLATSTGSGWTRASNPVWPPNSNFGPGAIWFDRFNRMLYFFGVRTQFEVVGGGNGGQGWTGVRLARVRSTPSAILDRTQYQYFDGSTWVTDSNGDMLEAIPASQGGSFGDSADLIHPTSATQVRPEISVAYDSFAGVWLLMLLNIQNQQIELWQAQSPIGHWNWVPVNSQLPSSIGSPAGVYAPFTNDELQSNGGEQVYFVLSEYKLVYNPGLWHFKVNRASSLCF